MTGARRPVAGLALAGALLATAACAPSVDPFERLGRKAAERVAAPDGALSRTAARVLHGVGRTDR
ncbi:hypothetical protein [Streptomyces sp. NPDC008121]|uniref:hypothetical protein n=1 Tax=Streptomyces sp. NPDC008121 TaxID=3364809 RepID=UPI0036EFBAD0